VRADEGLPNDHQFQLIGPWVEFCPRKGKERMAADPERAGDALPIPAAVEQLTAEWMTAALSLGVPGVEVTSLHLGPVRHGSNTTARLLLGYNRVGQEARLPPTMYVKGAWTGRGVGGTFNEARFYQHIAPRLSINLPSCYFAGVDTGSRQAVIVMEDLLARHVILGSAGQSFLPDQAMQLADQLAQLHALWFDDPALDEQDWLYRQGTVQEVDPETDEGILWLLQGVVVGEADRSPARRVGPR